MRQSARKVENKMDSRNLVCVGQSAFLSADQTKIVWCGNWVGVEDAIYNGYEEDNRIHEGDTKLFPLPEGFAYQWYGWVSENTYRLDVVNEKNWEIVEKRIYSLPNGTQSHRFYTVMK